ncbi:MAG: AraC family transcriptional regulator [Sneathiellaceae bacterium]
MEQGVAPSGMPAVSLAANGAGLRARLFATAREEADDAAAVRVHFDDDAGIGTVEFVEVSPDFSLMISDCHWRSAGALTYRGEGWIRFNFCLDAHATFRFDGCGSFDLRGRELRVFHQPEGLACDHLIGGNARSTCVTISVRKGFLAGRAALAGQLGGSCLGDLLAGSDAFFFRRYALAPSALRAVQDLLAMPYRHALRRVYAEAKAQELLCDAFQAVMAPPPLSRGGGVVLREADLARIALAAEILDREFAAPPTVDRLARDVGLNRNKLSYGFRQLHGLPMTDYLVERRLEAAWRLLQAGALPVTEVAAEVGYRHPASFSAAFRRRYGLAPREVRRKMTAATVPVTRASDRPAPSA